jgi:DNA-binding response OmpR family regulator
MGNAKQRILIAEDNETIRNFLFEGFLRKGFEVGIAENGENALKMFTNSDFDVVITDYKMPRMDGLTLANEIRKKQSKTIIIMMSADRHIEKKTTDVANYFLEKPFEFTSMHALVNHALAPGA